MDNRGKRQASSIFGGMGFYIALLVCVVAAGVVGYFALLNDEPNPEEDPIQNVSQTDPGPAQSVSVPESRPAQPVLSEEPIAVPAPAPQSPEEPASEPVSAPADAGMSPVPMQAPEPQEPLVVVAPLAGETAAAFSVDQLLYDATLGDWRTHDGIDICATAGDAVAAAAAGTVLSVEEDGRMGTTVVVEHQDGYVTTYASLQPETSVLAGDSVNAGTIIGAVGNTSLTEAGLGAHLHFSVTKDGQSIDPLTFLPS